MAKVAVAVCSLMGWLARRRTRRGHQNLATLISVKVAARVETTTMRMVMRISLDMQSKQTLTPKESSELSEKMKTIEPGVAYTVAINHTAVPLAK